MPSRTATVRTTCLAALAAMALATAQPAFAHGHRQDRSVSSKPGSVPAFSSAQGKGSKNGSLTAQGVVQLVSAKAVVLRLLDGTAVTVPIDRKTEILVGDRPGSLTMVKPGYVVVAVWVAGKPATVLRFLH